MKILITGGAGFIGSHLVEELSKNNKIIVVDDLSTGYKKLISKKIKFYKLDINKTLTLKKIIKKENIEIIIHLAAKISIQESLKNPKIYFKNNVEGTKSVLEASINSNVKAFIFSSTAAVYSGNRIVKCKENLFPRPINLYGETKYKAEKLIKVICNKNKIKFIIMRYFNVVGASKSGKIGPIKNYGQLFKKLSINAIKSSPKVDIFGINHQTYDGTCVRDYIDINDIVEIHKLFIKKLKKIKKGIVINCGYGKGYSVLDVVKNFEKSINKKIKIRFLKKRIKEISNIYADNSLIKKKFRWKPKYENLFLSVKRSLKWEKKISDV